MFVSVVKTVPIDFCERAKLGKNQGGGLQRGSHTSHINIRVILCIHVCKSAHIVENCDLLGQGRMQVRGAMVIFDTRKSMQKPLQLTTFCVKISIEKYKRSLS